MAKHWCGSPVWQRPRPDLQIHGHRRDQLGCAGWRLQPEGLQGEEPGGGAKRHPWKRLRLPTHLGEVRGQLNSSECEEAVAQFRKGPRGL